MYTIEVGLPRNAHKRTEINLYTRRPSTFISQPRGHRQGGKYTENILYIKYVL